MNDLNRILSTAILALAVALLAAPVFGQTADNSAWNGGIGVWTTTSLWTIDGQPATVYPNNTASTVFNVTIDSGQQDFVTLTSPPPITINSLTLGGNPNFSSSLAVGENGGAAGMLTIGSDTTPASLTVNSTGNLFVNANSELLLNIVSGNGTVTNNGVINVGSASGGAKLGLFDGGNAHQLTLSGSGTLTLSSGSALLGGEGDEFLQNNSTIQGAGTISNLVLLNTGSIVANGTLTITPNANSVPEGGQGAAGIFGVENSGTLTAGSGGTLVLNLTQSQAAEAPLLNGGVINVGAGGTLEIIVAADDTTRIGNTFGGQINLAATLAGAGSTLQLDGEDAIFDLTPLSPSTGTLTLSDSANNLITGVTGTETLINDVGETLSGAGTISNLTLVNNGTIIDNATANVLLIDPNSGGFTNNGTLQVNPGGTLRLIGSAISTSSATVTVDGTLDVNNMLTFDIAAGNATVTNNRVINLAPGASLLLSDAGNMHQLTLSGTGALAMQPGAVIQGVSGDESLVNNITIQGAGTISNVGVFNTGSIIANGTSPLVIDANTNLNNQGFQNSASVQVDAGSTLDIDASAAITAANQIFNSRTITVNDGGTLEFSASAGQPVKILNSLGSPAQIDIGGSGAGGTLELDGSNAIFDLYGSGGLLMLSDNANNLITGVTGTETFINDAGQTLSGAGTISNLALVNDGAIIANGTNALNIDPNAKGFTNNGTVDIQGSTLSITGDVTNTGVVQTVNGSPASTLIVSGTFTNEKNAGLGLNNAGDAATVGALDNLGGLTLNNAGTLTVIGAATIGANGSIDVTNSSVLNVGDDLDVSGIIDSFAGHNAVNAGRTLAVSAGGSVQILGMDTWKVGALTNSGSVNLGPQGTLTITGGGLGVTDIPSTASFLIQDGAFDVINDGVATSALANLTTVEGSLELAASSSTLPGTATTTVTPQGGTLSISSTGLVVAEGGWTLSVNGNVNNSGLLATETLSTPNTLNVSGVFTNTTGSNFRVSGTNDVANVNSLENFGTAFLGGFGLSGLDTGMALNLTGDTSSNSGTINLWGGALAVAGNLTNSGTIQSQTVAEIGNGVTGPVPPSSVTVKGTFTNDVNGTLMLVNSGDKAAFSSLANGGVISGAAGTFIGVGDPSFTATKGYQQLADGTLDELISGTLSFGAISVVGPASLDGTLDVTLEDGFIPTVGDQFAFLDFTPGELTGTFAGLFGQTFDNGLEKWDLSYNNSSGDVILTAVANTTATTPEPGSLLLFGTGLLGLAALLRKRWPVVRG
jgi:fibronectin-binding autotransporter adhesin